MKRTQFFCSVLMAAGVACAAEAQNTPDQGAPGGSAQATGAQAMGAENAAGVDQQKAAAQQQDKKTKKVAAMNKGGKKSHSGMHAMNRVDRESANQITERLNTESMQAMNRPIQQGSMGQGSMDMRARGAAGTQGSTMGTQGSTNRNSMQNQHGTHTAPNTMNRSQNRLGGTTGTGTTGNDPQTRGQSDERRGQMDPSQTQQGMGQ